MEVGTAQRHNYSSDFFHDLAQHFLTPTWREQPLYVDGVHSRLDNVIENLTRGVQPRTVFGVSPAEVERIFSTLLQAFRTSTTVLDSHPEEDAGEANPLELSFRQLTQRKEAQDEAFRQWAAVELGEFHTPGTFRFESLVEKTCQILSCLARPEKLDSIRVGVDFNPADPFSRTHYIAAINRALASSSVIGQVDGLINATGKLRRATFVDAVEREALIAEVSMQDCALLALGVLHAKALEQQGSLFRDSMTANEIAFGTLGDISSIVEQAGIKVESLGDFGDGPDIPKEIREQLNGLPPSIGLQVTFKGRNYTVVGILVSPKHQVVSADDEVEGLYLAENETLVRTVGQAVTPPPLPIDELAKVVLQQAIAQATEDYQDPRDFDRLKEEPEVSPWGDVEQPFWVKVVASDAEAKVNISVHDGRCDSENLGAILAEDSFEVNPKEKS